MDHLRADLLDKLKNFKIDTETNRNSDLVTAESMRDFSKQLNGIIDKNWNNLDSWRSTATEFLNERTANEF